MKVVLIADVLKKGTVNTIGYVRCSELLVSLISQCKIVMVTPWASSVSVTSYLALSCEVCI